MEITSESNGKILTVSPKGRMDSNSSGDFLDYVEKNFTEEYEKLVLDFYGVDFISSKGLRILVSIYKELNGRTMEIIGANTSVREVFRISGLSKTFGIQ